MSFLAFVMDFHEQFHVYCYRLLVLHSLWMRGVETTYYVHIELDSILALPFEKLLGLSVTIVEEKIKTRTLLPFSLCTEFQKFREKLD